MLFDLFLVIVGLIIGWFFLPTPQFVKDWMAALVVKWPALGNLIKPDPPV